MAIANQLRSLSLLTLLSSSLMLAACGGGGSGGGNTSSSTSSTPASSSSVSSESSSSEAPTFTLGGSLEGLAGAGLQLANGEENLSLSSNGNFAFTTALHQGDSYHITIAQQPSAPNQTCTLTNASGANVTANISNVQVSCTTNTYTVGGSVSGLTTTGLVLQNNAVDDLTVDADGNFVFATALDDQSAFSVSVKTQPEKHLCSVTNASGTLAGVNVSNVAISCLNAPAAPELALAYGPKLFKFTWDAVDGATHYKLLENADGNSGYIQVGDDITVTNYDEEVTLFNRIGAQYTLEACNQAGCNTSAVVNVSEHLEEAIGFIQPAITGNNDQVANGQHSIAFSEDGGTMVFGAPCNSSASDEDESDTSLHCAGSVYVYQKIGGAWQQQAYLKASNPDAEDLFGSAVALSASGDVLAVSAIGEGSSAQGNGGNELDNSVVESGAVYVYKRTGSDWTQQAYIKASNNSSVDYQQFGASLSISSDGLTLAVGAPGESNGATGINGNEFLSTVISSGAVFVYTYDGSDWIKQAYIKAPYISEEDYFGSVVSLSSDGNRLAVSAPEDDSPANSVDGSETSNLLNNSGAVYVFERALTEWTQRGFIKASNANSGDRFGIDLAFSDDGHTLVVGAANEGSASVGVNNDESDNSLDTAGAVYVFNLSEAGWGQEAYLKASNTMANYAFGISVAVSSDGNMLAVGALGEKGLATGLNGDQFQQDVGTQGAVYLFKRSNNTWRQQAYVKPSISGLGIEYGFCMVFTASGDTLAVGAAFAPKNNVFNDYESAPGGIYLY